MRTLPRLALAIAAAASLTTAARADLFGVDVSTHQGYVNWNSMKSDGIAFGFVKATEGVNFVDNRFTQNMTNARAAGVPIGPYHYARPDSAVGTLADPVKQDAINEANDFVDAIEPYYTDHPGEYLRPVLDVEEIPSTAEINTSSERRAYLSDWIRDFNSVVQDRLSVDVIIYTGGFYSQTYFESDLSAYDLWFAAPNGLGNPPSSSSTGIWDDWAFWQYSWTESIGGESPVDANVFRGDLDDLAAFLVDDPGLPGDYNLDGRVDAADYIVWKNNWLQFTDAGDGDGDGFVGNDDLEIWKENYGRELSTGGGGGGVGFAVPEPGAWCVLAPVACCVAARCRAPRATGLRRWRRRR